jgi:hypothetical protein
MEPTFTKTNRSLTMMRCLGARCNVFFVTGGNVYYGSFLLLMARLKSCPPAVIIFKLWIWLYPGEYFVSA